MYILVYVQYYVVICLILIKTNDMKIETAIKIAATVLVAIYILSLTIRLLTY